MRREPKQMNALRTCSWLLAALLLALAMGVTAMAQEEDEADALGGVIGDMQAAGGRLGKKLTDKPTQQREKDAIDKLDVLIKVLEERRQQGMGGRVNANPEDPANDSIIRQGPGGSGPLHDANRKGRGWGQLPAHKREQILQSMTEGFPSHYQLLLERYYRRLGEERPAGDGEDEAASPRRDSKPADAKENSPAMNKPKADKQAAG